MRVRVLGVGFRVKSSYFGLGVLGLRGLGRMFRVLGFGFRVKEFRV